MLARGADRPPTPPRSRAASSSVCWWRSRSINDPEIVFLDEPTTGLDPQARHGFWDLVRTIRARGKTIVLTTHNMEEAHELCDEIAILDHGKVIARGEPKQLLRQQFEGSIVELPAADFRPAGGLPLALVRVERVDRDPDRRRQRDARAAAARRRRRSSTCRSSRARSRTSSSSSPGGSCEADALATLPRRPRRAQQGVPARPRHPGLGPRLPDAHAVRHGVHLRRQERAHSSRSRCSAAP